MDYLYGCAKELAFLPTCIGREGTATHLTVLPRLSVLLELLYTSTSHHQYHFNPLLAHLNLNGLFNVPVDPLLVDAYPITDLLFLARGSYYSMREYEELSVFASWIGFDGIVNRRPEVEVKRNGDGLILDEVV